MMKEENDRCNGLNMFSHTPGMNISNDRKISLNSSDDMKNSRQNLSIGRNSHQSSSSNGIHTGELSVRDIEQHFPMEVEAETYLLKAIEASELPLRMEPNELTEQTILGGVPKEIAHHFSMDSNGTDTKTKNKVPRPETGTHVTKNNATLSKPSIVSRKKTTAEELWDLTSDVMIMQAFDMTSSEKRRTTADIDDEGMSSSDALARNAMQLMKRQRGNRSITDVPLDAEPEPTIVAATSAKVRWKKVQTAVKFASIANASAAAAKRDAEKNTPTNAESGFIQHDKPHDGDNVNHDDVDDADGKKKSRSVGSFHARGNIRKQGISEFHEFQDWFRFKKSSLYNHMRLLLYIVLPATALAIILFYVADNPPCGTSSQCKDSLNTKNYVVQASHSWWILFILVRQVFMITLAGMTQAVVVDFFCLRSKLTLKSLGPMLTLYTVQSKGWPFLMTWWGVYSFLLLYGKHKFAQHWLFWQSAIDVFNDTNPSGDVTELPVYRKTLILSIVIGVSVSIKRLLVGLILGRQTFHRYASDLATLMRKVLLVGQLATLAKDIEQYDYKLSDFDHQGFTKTIHKEWNATKRSMSRLSSTSLKDIGVAVSSAELRVSEGRVFGETTTHKSYNESSNRVKIDSLLGAWEEPREINKGDEVVNISSIIQFRTSLACLNTHLPFSSSFGPASSRKECVESAESVFRRLILATPGKYVLSFDVIALLAAHVDGNLDEEKVKELIKLFRPDREGKLTLIDFVKSIDTVYKEIRLLRASVASYSRMDRAFERIFNIAYYFIMACIVLSVYGVQPLVLFASVSGFVVGFAFMIGPACAKYFEGLLFILVRRPYDIGDRIHVSDPNVDTKANGSDSWFVRDVTLFTTTVCFASTNEVATYSNGSLAMSRIINHGRSPEAIFNILLKFPVSAAYDNLKLFRSALEQFVKARPREYLSFSAFRCTRVEPDFGFVEYTCIVTHRESWQNVRAILTSKAELSSFALELSKKMNLHYTSPPKSIDLSLNPFTQQKQWNGSNVSKVLSLNDFREQSTSLAMYDGTDIMSEGELKSVHAMFAKEKK